MTGSYKLKFKFNILFQILHFIYYKMVQFILLLRRMYKMSTREYINVFLRHRQGRHLLRIIHGIVLIEIQSSIRSISKQTVMRDCESADFIKQWEEMISYYGEQYVDDKNYRQETVSRELQHLQVGYQSHIDIIRCGTRRGAFLIFFFCTACGGGWLVS